MSRLLAATPLAAVDPVAALHRLRSDGDEAPARLLPGTRLFVQVIEPLLGGGVRARVLNGSAEYRLPFDAKPGARLQVLVGGTEEQPAFVLVEGEGAGADASLSTAARVLAALTAAAKEPARPPVVHGAAPLIADARIDARTLARALAEALARSGLFYEAHQAQWANGQRERATLLEEPQGRVTLRDVPGEHVKQAAEDGTVDRGSLHSVIHRDTMDLVRQQLAALETGGLVWHGVAWRGQEIEWSVQRDGPHDRHGDRNAGGPWSTRLHLALPHLGTVDAQLSIDAHGIEARITAHDARAAALLRDASSTLGKSFRDAGLNLTRLEVQGGT